MKKILLLKKNLKDIDIDNKEDDSNNLEKNDSGETEIINLNGDEDKKVEYESSTFNDVKNNAQEEVINDKVKEIEKTGNIDEEDNHYNEVLDNDDVKEELQYIDNLEMKDDENNESSVNSNDEVNKNNIVEDDIDEKTNNGASNIEIIDVKEQQNLDKDLINNRLVHLNDNDNVPLNISYSQLKDIVEEIIAEKENEQQDDGNTKYTSPALPVH